MGLLIWNVYNTRGVTLLNGVVIVVASVSYIGILVPIYKLQGYPGNVVNTEEFVIISYQTRDKEAFFWIYETGAKEPRNVVFPMTEGLKKNINDMDKQKAENPDAVFKGVMGNKPRTKLQGKGKIIDKMMEFVYKYTTFFFIDDTNPPMFKPLTIDPKYIKE